LCAPNSGERVVWFWHYVSIGLAAAPRADPLLVLFFMAPSFCAANIVTVECLGSRSTVFYLSPASRNIAGLTRAKSQIFRQQKQDEA